MSAKNPFFDYFRVAAKGICVQYQDSEVSKFLAIFGPVAAILDFCDSHFGGKECSNQKVYFAKVA